MSKQAPTIKISVQNKKNSKNRLKTMLKMRRRDIKIEFNIKIRKKMSQSLSMIDRFFHIITSSQQRNNQRILQEWSYLYTLLSSSPVSYDRIQAYLSILQSHDSSTKRATNKGKKSLTEHPKAKELYNIADQMVQMLELGTAKLKIYDQKYE